MNLKVDNLKVDLSIIRTITGPAGVRRSAVRLARFDDAVEIAGHQ